MGNGQRGMVAVKPKQIRRLPADMPEAWEAVGQRREWILYRKRIGRPAGQEHT